MEGKSEDVRSECDLNASLGVSEDKKPGRNSQELGRLLTSDRIIPCNHTSF